jgi:hypothetical protein
VIPRAERVTVRSGRGRIVHAVRPLFWIFALGAAAPALAGPAPVPWSRADLDGPGFASALVIARFDRDSLPDLALTDLWNDGFEVARR